MDEIFGDSCRSTKDIELKEQIERDVGLYGLLCGELDEKAMERDVNMDVEGNKQQSEQNEVSQ